MAPTRKAVEAETPRQPRVSTVGPKDPETPRQLLRSLGLPESVTRPFHPLLRDDIKWERYAFGKQEADKQEARLRPSFVQPAVKHMQ